MLLIALQRDILLERVPTFYMYLGEPALSGVIHTLVGWLYKIVVVFKGASSGTGSRIGAHIKFSSWHKASLPSFISCPNFFTLLFHFNARILSFEGKLYFVEGCQTCL